MNDLPTRRAFNRAGAAALDREIDAALAVIETQKAVAIAAAKALRAQRLEGTGTVTRDAVAAARVVRDATGWHQVIRVNRATVTVPGPWGGTRTIRIDRLIEVKA